jgi:hypothetical protein
MRYLLMLMAAGAFHSLACAGFAQDARFTGTWRKDTTFHLINKTATIVDELHFAADGKLEHRNRNAYLQVNLTQLFYAWSLRGDTLAWAIKDGSVSLVDSGGPDQEVKYEASSANPDYLFEFPDANTLSLTGALCRSGCVPMVYKRVSAGRHFTLADLTLLHPNGLAPEDRKPEGRSPGGGPGRGRMPWGKADGDPGLFLFRETAFDLSGRFRP